MLSFYLFLFSLPFLCPFFHLFHSFFSLMLSLFFFLLFPTPFISLLVLPFTTLNYHYLPLMTSPSFFTTTSLLSTFSSSYNHTHFLTTTPLTHNTFLSQSGSYEGLSQAELIREVERREAEVLRLESQHRQLTEALGRHSEQAGEGSALLQVCVRVRLFVCVCICKCLCVCMCLSFHIFMHTSLCVCRLVWQSCRGGRRSGKGNGQACKS